MRVPVVNTSLQIVISLFSLGCTQLPKQIPKDFQLLIKSTAIQPSANGNYSLMIRRTASENQFELTRSYENLTNKFIINSFAVQRLYDEIRQVKIFNLNNSYSDMSVLDGSNITLIVRADGKTKVINMRNKQPDELKSLLSIVREFELTIR